MIIQVWEGLGHPQDNLEMQKADVPATTYRRMLLKDPTVGDLAVIKERLDEEGVPSHAKLEFSRWKTPETNWYLYAVWDE